MGWKLGCLIAIAALISTWSVGAQETPTPQAVTSRESAAAPPTEIVIGPYQFTVDPSEPLQAHIVARSTNLDGSFVTWYGTAQLADGSVVGVTICDDVAVTCAPIISPAKAAFQLADPGDSFNLQPETTK
jgi:hypothetical protein